MKRFFALLLALCMILSLCACSKPEPVGDVSTSSQDDPVQSSSQQTAHSEQDTQEPIADSSMELPDITYMVRNMSVQVYRNESGAVWAMALIEVENTGDEFLFLGDATLPLTDESGHEVARMESVPAYPQVIAPGEVGCYCDVVALDATEEPDLFPGFAADISTVTDAPVLFSIGYSVLSNSLYGGLSLSVTVENTTQQDCDLVCVGALLRDKNGLLLGFISGYLDGALEAGESQTVNLDSFMLPTELKAEQVAEMEIYAFPLLEQP